MWLASFRRRDHLLRQTAYIVKPIEHEGGHGGEGVAESRGAVTDPRSWGVFIKEVGVPGSTIFALLAILAYLAFKGVPAIVALSQAIQQNTDTVAATGAAAQKSQSENYGNMQTMISQHGQIIDLLIADSDSKRRLTALAVQKQTCINTSKSLYQAKKCMDASIPGPEEQGE